MTRTMLRSILLALLALTGLSRPGGADAHAQSRAQSRVRAGAQAGAPEIAITDLVGTWLGRPVEVNRSPDSVPLWHLVVRADSTYVWKAHENYAGLDGDRPQRWRGLRGDTLAFDDTHVYLVQRKGTRTQPELWLTALPAGDSGQVFRLQREWTSTAVTGRPIPCRNGHIKTFGCANVELLSYLPTEALGLSAGYDLWGWHDSATGREFLISGGYATAFVEVTDPVHPRYLGMLPPHDTAAICFCGQQSVKVYQHYALIAYDRSSENNGLQIFDLTQLREVKAPTTFQETAHYDGFRNTHTLTLNPATGFLTANGSNTCGGGMHMLDVRTPTKPVYLGCYTELAGGQSDAGYVHDAQCVIYHGPDRAYQGREICVNYLSNAGRVVVADVTDRQRPKTLSLLTYPDAAATHQGWFTNDQRYAFLDDEMDEWGMVAKVGFDGVRTRTIGLDLTDLDEPVVLVEYSNPYSRSTDHNLYIRGRYMYQGNYGAGLQILDVSDPKAPKVAGYLSPKRGDAGDKLYDAGNGRWVGPRAWGTYPYLKNDVVALSLTSGIALARLRKP